MPYRIPLKMLHKVLGRHSPGAPVVTYWVKDEVRRLYRCTCGKKWWEVSER